MLWALWTQGCFPRVGFIDTTKCQGLSGTDEMSPWTFWMRPRSANPWEQVLPEKAKSRFSLLAREKGFWKPCLLTLGFSDILLEMAPRKGKEKKEEQVISLGPQVAEGENVFGVCHIFASFNDTFVHVTDLSGKWVSGWRSTGPHYAKGWGKKWSCNWMAVYQVFLTELECSDEEMCLVVKSTNTVISQALELLDILRPYSHNSVVIIESLISWYL